MGTTKTLLISAGGGTMTGTITYMLLYTGLAIVSGIIVTVCSYYIIKNLNAYLKRRRLNNDEKRENDLMMKINKNRMIH